jgi:hypothetical protein
MESKKIIKEFNPDVVIGTGGFASGPLLNSQHDGYSYRNPAEFLSWDYE